MEIKLNHAPDRTVAGYVVRTNMAVDAKKGVSYSVKIRCEQCDWTHWLEVNEEQYQQALEAMNSGASFDSGRLWVDVSPKYLPS